MIGPFFYFRNGFIAHKIPVEQGEVRCGKVDNPYSHERLYDVRVGRGDYINVPRGRVVWDTEQAQAIIYIDVCIEKISGAVERIAKIFDLKDYIVKHDNHYVCPKCIDW